MERSPPIVATHPKDIFSLFVGNIPPKENVTVRISYLQELDLVTSTLY